MSSIITIMSRFIFAIVITLYTFTAYSGYRERNKDNVNPFRVVSFICVLLFAIMGFLLIFINKADTSVLAVGGIYIISMIVFYAVYRVTYGTKTHTLIMNMLMMSTVSVIILYRLSEDKATRQLTFLAAGGVILLLIPYIVRKILEYEHISIIAGILSVALLVFVLIMGKTSYGAILSIDLGIFSIQPFEIVKVLYVIFMAGTLKKDAGIKNVAKAGVLTAIDVILLALANDFGAVLILLVVYLVTIFVASTNVWYLVTGVVGAGILCPLAVKYIPHITIRFKAWIDPFSIIENKGYQICQSLFAIVAGGFFGTGLYKGMPDKIPVVEKDFIFSAIVEEFGLIVGVCIILIALNVFIILMDMALKHNGVGRKVTFARIVFVGFGTLYIFQVLLTIGGAVKFIPSTGVTLPLVSYGGSSLLGTILMLSTILALNIERRKKDVKKQGEFNESVKGKNNKCIQFVTYAFVIIFVFMIVWVIYLVGFSKESIENNSYNKRIDSWAESVIRGTIYSADGQVLAETTTDEAGNEKRVYPYNGVFAHSVGFSTNGKAGVEKQMNYYLLSTSDKELTKVIKEAANEKSAGYDVITTLNVDMSKAAYDAIGNYSGACVALDVATGEVLCMVSKPGYDPNIIDEEWDNIINDSSNTSLLNRVTSGLYPPGSTFKTLTLLEYIRENPDSYEDYSFDCSGSVSVENSSLSCIYHSAHGNVNLNRAFAYSCNCSFSTMGLKLNMNKYKATCEELFFNTELPVAFECKESSFTLDENSTTFDIMQTAMGQGQTLITPMHNVMIAAAIANGGVSVKPYLVSKVIDENKDTVMEYQSEKTTVMTAKEAEILSGYMRNVVEYGTAKELLNGNYEAYGKTGSAQFTNDNLNAYHSWFVGFAKYDDRTIAICTVIENVEDNSNTGKNVAKKVLDAYKE